MSELLTACELAVRLQVKTSTIKRWAREGRLPSVRFSTKVVRFDPVQVDRVLRERAQQRGGKDVA